MTLSKLNKPINRCLPNRNLVIRITERGVEFRRYRSRRWRFVTWEQIAALASIDQPIIQAAEHSTGADRFRQLGID